MFQVRPNPVDEVCVWFVLDRDKSHRKTTSVDKCVVVIKLFTALCRTSVHLAPGQAFGVGHSRRNFAAPFGWFGSGFEVVSEYFWGAYYWVLATW